MRTLHVVFPVLRGSRRFFIQRGRRWSVIEHLLLDAVAREPRSAGELSNQSGLPRRVIVEALIRLMRAGWVEITATTGGPIFRATPSGALQAPLDQLPAATVIQPRWRSFAIEQITGGVLRSRELDIRPLSKLPTTTNEQIVIHLPASPLGALDDLREVFTAIEGEDELIIGVEKSPEKLVERHAVVTVREDAIEGLPWRASQALRLLIKAKSQEIAAELVETDKGRKTIQAVDAIEPERVDSDRSQDLQSRDALYDPDDLIVDGPAHSTALDRAIRNACQRVIVHSTFIAEARAKALLPSLLQAAARGATIDVFWGQDDVGSVTSESRAAAKRLQAAIAEAGRSDSISIHAFSTQSHAKVVIADNGKGAWHALVGSCNWLASDFTSFEASVRVREPALVGELMCKLARLARGRPGLWNDLAIEMTVLGRRVEKLPRGSGRTVPMRLLYAPDHAKLVLEARDRARRRIFVLSHRIGIASRPMALLPTLAAVRANSVEASIYYGRTTGALSGIDSAALTREFAKQGMTITPVHRPRLHAKVLGWDDNALCVSSLNWLSADPADVALYREIGVLIEAPRSADNFIRRFEHARID